MMHPPEVDFRVRAHPAQSVSEYTSMCVAFCLLKLNTILGCFLRYRPNLFKAYSVRSLGADMKQHISLAANMIECTELGYLSRWQKQLGFNLMS